jgi:hypothetical protein
MDPFYKIPEYPEHVSSTSVLTRLLDGLGFRFHWATEGLRPEDYSYRPGPDTMSVSELVGHIWGLINWVTISTLGESRQRPEEDESVRSEILDMIWELREAVHSMDEEDLGRITIEGRPFWNMINGPISDALTHVGQVNSFRRLSGNPVPPANVFSGEPPRE